MMQCLDMIDSLAAWFWDLPKTLLLFIYGVMLTYTIAAGGYALARTGIRPLWVLLLLIPTVNVIAIWLWAYLRWPAVQAQPIPNAHSVLNTKKEQ